MKLSRFAREYYELTLTTSPATLSTDWAASFDDGATWVNAIDVGGKSAWLLAGRLVGIGTAVAQLRHDTTPLVRLISNPEIVVRDAPAITVT